MRKQETGWGWKIRFFEVAVTSERQFGVPESLVRRQLWSVGRCSRFNIWGG
jgi:hypothetical protein